MKILTWHTHGSYLYYLTQVPHDFYVLSKPDRPPGYTGRWGHLPWGSNVHDLPVEEAKSQPLDCILFQDDDQYLRDQYEFLSAAQRHLPRIYLEHDPPREHATDARHPVNDPNMLLVHVTPFNELMWDSGRTPTRVIEHGVIVPGDVHYRGDLSRGLVIVNHIGRRGRRLGADIFDVVRRRVLLDLIGMGAEEYGGLGEVRHGELASFASHYRFLFNPIRYTSLGLAVIETMMIGLPIIGLATTEMATAVRNGLNGYVDTRIETLIERMNLLLSDAAEAHRLSRGARTYAAERFNIKRFVRDWEEAFAWVMRTSRPVQSLLAR
ncbi:MAG TPA: glycosyltransferase [Burkholderiales bacterium]|nr:glycosyltransferase [Burkholderiales bacterium]